MGNPKQYNLEERTFPFAKNVALSVKTLPKTSPHAAYGEQVIRSSGSVGANDIEANEALSKKDFLMRIKICRKEAKESAYWLKLIVKTNDNGVATERIKLCGEAGELKKIISAIHGKSM